MRFVSRDGGCDRLSKRVVPRVGLVYGNALRPFHADVDLQAQGATAPSEGLVSTANLCSTVSTSDGPSCGADAHSTSGGGGASETAGFDADV